MAMIPLDDIFGMAEIRYQIDNMKYAMKLVTGSIYALSDKAYPAEKQTNLRKAMLEIMELLKNEQFVIVNRVSKPQENKDK